MLAKRQTTAPSRISVRYYLWSPEGPLKITRRLHRELFGRDVAMPQFAGTKQKIFEVFIHRLTSRDYSISARGIVYPFDAKGFLDIKALALEGSLELSRFRSTETNIFDLRPSIKRRRFTNSTPGSQAKRCWTMFGATSTLVVTRNVRGCPCYGPLGRRIAR